MTDAAKPRAWRWTIRAAGATALLAGGWCCWLALAPSSGPPAAEPAAFHDWSDSQTIEAAPDSEKSARPRVLAATITDIVPVAADDRESAAESVIFADFEQTSDAQPSIERVQHTSSGESNSVWLTGTIDDEELAKSPADEQPKRLPRQRTGKSAKRSALRTAHAQDTTP